MMMYQDYFMSKLFHANPTDHEEFSCHLIKSLDLLHWGIEKPNACASLRASLGKKIATDCESE